MNMKLIRKIHLWLSVPFGILIFVVCFTGATLVFEKEITNLVQGETATETVAQGKAEVGKQGPHGHGKRLPFFDVMFKTHRWLMDAPARGHGKPAMEAKPEGAPKTELSAKAEGKDAQVGKDAHGSKDAQVGKPNGKRPTSAGRVVVGITTIAFAVILVTGVMLWWPRMQRGGLRKSLRIVRGHGPRAFWSTFHVSVGVWVTIFLLAMALTGLTWSFGWYKELFSLICSSKKVIYQIHTGAWGGITTRIIWFATALCGATLPLTGYYMWLKRIRH